MSGPGAPGGGWAYALFRTPTDGMCLRRILRERGLPCQVCPTPRDLDDSCGIALRFDPDRIGEVEAEARGADVPVRIVLRGAA